MSINVRKNLNFIPKQSTTSTCISSNINKNNTKPVKPSMLKKRDSLNYNSNNNVTNENVNTYNINNGNGNNNKDSYKIKCNNKLNDRKLSSKNSVTSLSTATNDISSNNYNTNNNTNNVSSLEEHKFTSYNSNSNSNNNSINIKSSSSSSNLTIKSKSKTKGLLKNTNNNKSLTSFASIAKETTISTNNIQVKCLINKHESLNSLNHKINTINISTKPTFTTQEYRKYETLFQREHHGDDMISSLLKEENTPIKSLHKHKVTERMRMRMIDWMIEVINNYKCDESSFFHAINLMDEYFSLCADKSKQILPEELHLIGVTCMFISSKYQDIYPLRLKTIYEKIAHKKLDMKDIKNKEADIMQMKNFIICEPTSYEFINYYIEEIFTNTNNDFGIKDNIIKELMNNNRSNIKNNKIYNTENNNNTLYKTIHNDKAKKYTENMINLIKLVSLYLAKMNLHDYNLIDNKPSLLAASTLFVALKISEQINKEEYLNEYFTKRLAYISNKNENDIVNLAKKILHNAQNFDANFPGLENLKKVHFNAIIDLKSTK